MRVPIPFNQDECWIADPMSEATPLPTSPVGNALTSITVRPGPYFERINAQRRTIIDVYLLL